MPNRILIALGAGFAALLLLLAPVQAQYAVPDYDGLVNDYAGIIDDTVEVELETRLQELALATNGAELAVVTITSLEGDTIQNVSQEFFDTWEIGKEGVDNGVLFLIASDDRELNIQTGYGTEAVLTDAQAGRIIRDVIVPYFKQDDYTGGVVAGVDAIVVQINDPEAFPEPVATTNDSSDTPAILVGLAFLAYFGSGMLAYGAAFLGRSKAWWPGGMIGAVLGFALGSTFGAIGLGLFGLFLDYILSKNYKQWKLEKKATDWASTTGGFISSSGSSSSSSSGFSSFGGGSSGGGGASGSW